MAKLPSNQEIENALNQTIRNFTNAPNVAVTPNNLANNASQTSLQAYNNLSTLGVGNWLTNPNTNMPDQTTNHLALALQWYLNEVRASNAVDALERQGFGETYRHDYGGQIQRLTINMIKPISPRYNTTNISNSAMDGDSYAYRPPTVNQRFHIQNFDYQNIVTLVDDYALTQVLGQNNGISNFASGLQTALESGFVVEKFNRKLEAIGTILQTGYQGATTNLIDTEELAWRNNSTPTNEELVAFIQLIKTYVEQFQSNTTSALNPLRFNSYQNPDELVLLIRAGLMTKIETETLAIAFNENYLRLPVKIVIVPHFGMIVAGASDTTQRANNTPLPSFGAKWGDVTSPTTSWVEQNPNVMAMLCDKGMLFESQSDNYQIETERNKIKRFTNFIASRANTIIACDPARTQVAFVSTPPE